MRLLQSALFLVLMLTPVAVVSARLTLSEDGRTDYVIVTPLEPSPSVVRAASELQAFLGQITGAVYRIVTEKAPIREHEIVLGAPRRLAARGVTIDIPALGPEGYVLKTIEGTLVVAGSDVRGVMYGVYGLLTDHLGCRWFTPTVSRIPRQPTLRLPELSERVVPALEYRWPAVRDCYDAEWCTRNRVNVGPKLGPEHGGSVTFCGWAHTFEKLVPAETYFDAHPEYFAQVDGKRLRARTQLCCTNKEVVRLVTEGIRKRMRENPSATYFSVSQNDWGNHCQCSSCQELAAREESQMGPVLQLVNSVADAVRGEFPGKRVTTLAYQWSRKPPKTIRPVSNVTIRLCSIECCFSHPFTDCDFKANVSFCDDIRGWAAICDNLWIWNYTTNFRNYFLPHPALRALNDDIQFFLAHNVKGVYEQDTKLTLAGEMSELGAYMMARFLWDAGYDENVAINEFLDVVYGNAAGHIRAYIDLLHDKVQAEKIHLRCFTRPKAATFLDRAVLDEANRLFGLAEESVSGTPEVLKRVKVARLPVDYAHVERLGRGDTGLCKIDHQAFTVEPLTDVTVHAQRFLTRAKAAGVRTLREQTSTLADYEKSVSNLLCRRLTPHEPLVADRVKPGIRATYFEVDAWPGNGTFNELTPVAEAIKPRIDLSMRKRDRMFGFLFRGAFLASADGVYTFHFRAEGGSELRVAGETIVDARRAGAAHAVQGHVGLRKGWHPLWVRFREFGYNDGLDLRWSGPGTAVSKLAPGQLGHIAP
ncbi:MAG: DUF4838 domain-containing protein [Lentisphaerae bacterium]|nr:DUF4838 domain-containing protein [Lentisphaerota bacterium]MBT4820896.1 DUF4838 domain-containing protein [Lentisphaerota bacterium]MBT5610749.1 DUF4838 domain-containing protein [Lentisphaerota bacterium]MBT7060831.1 DUF4838 domain-containing protein [Lentisphaerota bacterium]MBT7841280.1 DUF4838 domain-containing protein [Lentisphaerota bacterium]